MGKKNKRLHAQTITLFLITMLAALLSLTSCDFLGDVADPSADEPVKEWLERYTETAAIERHTVQGYTTTDNNGATCIPSDSDKTVTLYLRNPRGYTLNMSYILADGTKADPESISLEQDADDPSIVRITYSKDFLLAHEGGGNIGGTVTIQDTGTQRYFEDYAINLTCNTAPPGVQNAMVQLSGEEYVLCFFLPTEKLNSETHAQDEHVLHIQDASGNHKTAIVSAGFEQELISATPPADLESIYENGAVFDGAAQSGYTAYYWHTGITTTQTSSVRYSVWLTDRGGLSSSTAQTSGNLMGLARPKVFAGEDELDTYWIRKVPADDETGTATLTIKQTTTTWGTEVTGVTLSYTATDEEGNTTSGIDTDTATLTLEASKTYSITVKATKPLYASCTINFKVQVLPSEKIYVSENGSDEAGNGSKESPYATINKAVAHLAAMPVDTTREARIYVSSTLSDFATVGSSVAGKAASITIQKAPEAVSAVLDGNNTHYLLNITTSVPVTIQGITLQNGSSGTGGGMTVGDSADVTLGEGTVVQNCTANGNGGGVYVNLHGNLTVDGATIKGNSASGTPGSGGGIYAGITSTVTIKSGSIEGNSAVNGAGIYVMTTGNLTMSGGTISGCSAVGGNGGAVYVTTGATFKMSGSAAIPYGNAAGKNDVYLSAGFVTVGPALTGSAPVATITLPAYTEGRQVLSGTEVAAQYTKFALSNDAWSIGSNGKLTAAGGVKEFDASSEEVRITDPSKTYIIKGNGSYAQEMFVEIPAGTAGNPVYHITLDSVTRTASQYAGCFTITTHAPSATVFITLTGSNTLRGGNHGGIKIAGDSGSTVTVVFLTEDEATLTLGSQSSTSIQVEAGISASISIAGGIDFSDGKIGSVKYEDSGTFFNLARNAREDCSFEIEKD